MAVGTLETRRKHEGGRCAATYEHGGPEATVSRPEGLHPLRIGRIGLGGGTVEEHV